VTRLGDVTFERANGVLVARLTGELDMSNAEDIGSAVLEATSNDAVGVILDLSAVEYLDSAGIYVVFGMRSRLRARGQSLRLNVSVGSPVDDALRLAGVQSHVDVVDTVERGIEEMQATQGTDAGSGL
jgi:anti-sigma B factor antagonist